MGYPETFRGFASPSHEHFTDFQLLAFKPKPWSDDDVDIEITHCGVCGSDVHMISGVCLSLSLIFPRLVPCRFSFQTAPVHTYFLP